MSKYFNIIILAVVSFLLFASPLLADDTCCSNGNGSEIINPVQAFLVVDEQLSKSSVERGEQLTVTINLTNYGNSPACSIEIVDYLDDNFDLVPGTVEISPTSSQSSLGCQYDNQYANPNRIVFTCDWLKEYGSGANNISIKFNLTVNDDVNATRNLSEINHVNIVNVTGYYGSYSNNQITCTDINEDVEPIGTSEPKNLPNEPGAAARRGNMTDSENFTVIPRSAISVVKDASVGIAEVGDHINYTIYITNLGAYDVTINNIYDLLPTGFDAVTTILPPFIIKPGETVNRSYEVVVTSDAYEGQNINYVNVSGITTSGKKVSGVSSDVVFIIGRTSLPHLIIEKSAVTPTVNKIGDVWMDAEYRVVVRNTGSGKAYNITVTDQLPSSKWNINSLLSYSCDDNNIVTYEGDNNFSISGFMSPGASCMFQYKVAIAKGEKDGLYINTAGVRGFDGYGHRIKPFNVEDSAYVLLQTVTGISMIQITKTADNVNPEPGDIVNFTINICNPLTENITDIKLVDYLPLGFDFIDATNRTDARLINTTEFRVLWNIPALEQGMTNCKTLFLTTRVNSTVLRGVNANTVTAEGNVTTGTAYGATDLILNVRKPQITARKDVMGNVLVMPGENVTYKVEVQNMGDAALHNITINDTLPVGWQHLGSPYDIFPDWCGVYRINDTFFLNTSLIPLGMCTFKYNVYISLETGDGQYYNTIKAYGKDKSGGINGPAVDTADVFIRGFAALEVIKKLSTDQIEFEPGDTVGFNISISNRGHGTIKSIDIKDILPTGFDFINFTCPASVTCIPSQSGSEVSTSFNYELNPDDTIIVQVFTKVTSNAISGALPNKVTVTAIRSDGGILLDKDIAMVVIKKPYLTIDKWTPTPTRTSGTSITYLIRVRNIGTGTAKNITIEDDVPAGFTHTNSTESPKRLSGACSDVVILSHNATNTSYTFGILGDLEGTDECLFQYVVSISQNVSDGTYPNIASLNAKDASGADLPEQTVTAYVFVVSGSAVDVKKTSDKGIAAPGDIVNFTITVSNKGDSPAEVSIVDTLPYGFYTYDQLSWASEIIPPKSTITKNIVATVNTTAPEFNLNRVEVSGFGPLGSYMTDDIAIVIVKKPHVSISKVALTENTYSGGDVKYAINVVNDGGANAHNVYIVDNLPGNFTYNMDVGNCSSYNVDVNPNSSANQITFNISDFVPGKCTFYFSAHVPNGTPDGLYGNTLSGFYTDVAGGNYIIPARTDAYVSVRSAKEALKIFIDKTTNQSYLEIGDQVSFTLTVTNPSLTPIGNVYIQDFMPPGFIVNSCSISDNSNMSEDKCNGSEVTYHGLMPSSGKIIVHINATVTSSAIEYTTFNKATAYALNADGTIGLKSDDIELLVVGKPHLDIIKESVDATAIPGEIVKYHVIVKNTGTGTAKNVTVTDHLQQAEWNITGIAVSSGCGNVTYSNNKFTINNSGKFSQGAYCEFYYDVSVPSNESDGNYVNYVEVTGQDLLGALLMKDKDEAYQSVLSQPGLFVKKRANATSYLHGDIVQYTINITNTGNSNLTDIIIKDFLPEGFIFNSISGAILNNNCSNPESNLYCFNLTENIGAKSTGTVILTANATQNATEGLNINTVDVYATSADGGIIEGSAIAVISLKRPYVTYSKVVLTENRYPGENVSYLITIRNEGTTASTINMADNLPDGFTYNNDVTKCADFNINATVIGNDVIIFKINNFSQGECSFLYSVHIPNNASSGIYSNKLSGNYTNDNGINYELNNLTAAQVCVIKSEGANLFLGKSVDKTSVDIGEVVRFTINITNPLLTSINNALVHDTLPDGFVVVACNSTRTELEQQQCSGNTVRFNGTLSPGTALIIIDAIVTSDASEFLNINTVTFKGETISGTLLNENAIAHLNVKKPHLDIEKWVEGNLSRVKGSSVEYHIKIRNTGTGDATNITIADSRAFDSLWGIGPVTTINCEGIIVNECNGDLTSCSASESSPEIFALGNPTGLGFGTLPPGAECHFAYNLTIPNTEPGLYENNATVYGKDNYGTDLQTHTDEAYIQVVKTGILLRKEMNATLAQPGDYITSKIYLTNLGPTTVNNLIINDTLPSGWAYIAGSATRDGVQLSCSQDGKNLACSPFTISPYESTIVEFSLYITNTIGDGINTNRVKASWEDNSGNYYSSNASASLTVEKPELNLVKSVDMRYVEPGARPMFTLIVQNPTHAKIMNLSLIDYMPIGFTYVNGTTQLDGLNYSDPTVVGNYNTTGENLTWYISDIDPKTIKVLTFIARVKCNVTDGNFTNNASVSGLGKDGSMISADAYIYMSGHKANATLYKYASKQIVGYYDMVNYTIVIFNPATSANIQPLTLVDQLPRGMRYIMGSGYVGAIQRDPKITGTYSDGFRLEWNLSDHFITIGQQLAIKYTVKIGRGADTIVTNYATLNYLDPPQPFVDDHIFKTNASNTIGCKDCYGDEFNISSEPTNYTLHLHEGWNLISIPIQPYNTSLNSILAPINGKYDAVVTFTTDWLYYIQNGNSWVTTLNIIEPGRGYWINMKEEADLTVYGNTITNATVALHEGWNLVGMPVERSLNIDQLTIKDKWIDIYTFTTSWVYKSYSHESYFGNLDTMDPGRGYWINMVEPGELMFVP